MASGFLFYATFIPGLQDFIADVIKERLSDVRIHRLLDGAVLFETETSYDKLNFFCFNNIFAVIDVMEEDLTQRHKGTKVILEKHIQAIIENSGKSDVIANNSKSFKTFRIVASKENVPAAIDNQLRTEIERYISRLSGLKVNRSLPDTEFWFLFRREETGSFSIFMKRLTLRQSWEKTLHKGELPPPLAWTLCRLAALSHTDTVLDPFCGYGSIPCEALKHFHIKKFIACDNNREAFSYTASRFKKQKEEKLTLYNQDYEKLPGIIEENSVDAIITDPPWGQFGKIDEVSFYKNMFEVFYKLLKKEGRAVILCANDCLLQAAENIFTLKKTIPVLLSGKKAVIYKLIKTPKTSVPSPRSLYP